MFTVTELKHFSDTQAAYHILKPWWDVLCHYISMVMLLIAVLGGALQFSQSKLLCLPCKLTRDKNCTVAWDFGDTISSVQSETIVNVTLPNGITNYLDRQQYSYVDAVCYEKQLHWFAKFFPYLVLLQTFIFVICGNFWLKFPSTSSRLEHFVAILHKCFDSPWTTRSLSETVAEQRSEKLSFSKSSNLLGFSTTDVESSKSLISHAQIGPEIKAVDTTISKVLDKREGEQAKAIFEKVKKFRMHVEEKDIIYKLYMKQIIAKVVMLVIIMIYVPYFVSFLTFNIDCLVDIEAFTGYQRYHCVHSLATVFQVLASFYVVLVTMYEFMCFYSLWWMFRSSLKQYSFAAVREESSYSDIPDVKNDFAFILHLSDQYDPLYSKRFSIFLSEVSENKLKQINLNHEWTTDKLKQKLTKNAKDKVELHLFMLSGLPDSVFELTEIEVLKLELISEAKLPSKVTQLVNLKELWLLYSTIIVDLPALYFLSENVRILHLKFAELEKGSGWIFSLSNLKELYLVGSVSLDNNRILIEGLQKLKNLRVLYLRSSLPHIPQVVIESLPSLYKLSINNEGTRLLMLNSLKKMTNLKVLELMNCDLERIPHSIVNLINLREINLKGNYLKTVEEIISFQHLQKLSCLKLWHNTIAYIPIQIGTLADLEQLYLNHNKIKILPVQLLLCSKIRHLDISHNNLNCIPEEIYYLKNLQYFSVTNNYIEALPDSLFQCKNLQYLLLGRNSLSTLSPQICELVNLIKLELTGNQLELLPVELERCRRLKSSGLIVEESLFNSLPSSVKDHLQKSDKLPL
nr:PREDICTED: volume-regulated anion channel subunit LRRC8B [Latimeria chalumnae]|eukprot:XP_005997755.1 PREDICTED: volume-regulated anion channel subunit LRRC8B [Latimeria chalumnae]